MTFERHTVRLVPGEEVIPGRYSLRDGAALDRRPTAERCPYCEASLVELVTTGALRVAVVTDPPIPGGQPAGVETPPQGTRLLKCDPCAQIFSRVTEAA